MTFDFPPDAVGQALRIKSAGEMGVEVHGVLWLLDQLRAASNCLIDLLVAALETWRGDPTVFLPDNESEKRLRVLRRPTRKE